MLKRLAAGLCALAALAGPVLAQQSCDAGKLSSAIDRYAMAPFSALTWRVLEGHGDPMLDATTLGNDAWSQRSRWKSLTSAILPGATELHEPDWNCRIAYPLEVLEKRIAALGRDNPYVRQWLLAQQSVVRSCSGSGGADAALPPPLDVIPTLADLQKQDRAYQEASIAFYRDKEKAVPLFRAIAAGTSPHRAAARYNIANLLANARQLEEARKEADAIVADPALASVHGITRELLGYIANLQDTAEGWSALIDREVAILEMPADKILGSEDLKREYAAALYDIDFARVRAKDGDWWLDGTLPENPTVSKALVEASRKHALVLWMIAGQSANEVYAQSPWGLIGAKWQDRMTAYIGKADALQPAASGVTGAARTMFDALKSAPGDAERQALWDAARSSSKAAESSCGTDSQTAAAGFLLAQAVRLSALAGRFDEAYAGLAAAPFKPARSYYELTLLKLAQYLVGQGNLAEARKLRDRLVTPELLASIPAAERTSTADAFAEFLALIAEDQAHFADALHRHSDPGSNTLLNLLPAKALWALASDTGFGNADRALFARAAWTRDYAMGRKPTKAQTDALQDLNPAIKDASAKAAADYPKAGPERLRLLTILRYPRHNILTGIPDGWPAQSLAQDTSGEIDTWDHNDKNWWCPLEPDRQLGALRAEADEVAGTRWLDEDWQTRHADVFDSAVLDQLNANRDAVLRQHPMVRAISWKDVRSLARMPSAPQKLTEAAIRWAKASNGDDGAPEALALAVKTTRYGCNWHGGHARYSKAAQQLLHKKFRDTRWAKDTPYWFGCQRSEWDKDYNKITTCEVKTWPKQAPLR